MSEVKRTLTVICLGDVVGRPGRTSLKRILPKLRSEHSVDLVVVNGENAAGGSGIDSKTAREIFDAGVDVITLGDHTWQRKEFYKFLADESHRVIRPANYPAGAPGKGYTCIQVGSVKVGIANLIGRVFTGQLVDCPFSMCESLFDGPLKECTVRIVDMHAEATSEKVALSRLVDGQASILFGTHTHVQTADVQILPGGTGYITDLGMCGPFDGVIGMDAEVALKRLRTGMPHGYEVASGATQICGIKAIVDVLSGKTCEISLIRELMPANLE